MKRVITFPIYVTAIFLIIIGVFIGVLGLGLNKLANMIGD
jgi:hypothetical protein